MAFVHGHARDAGWVVSHYRRPQASGESQLDLDIPADLPAPRPSDDQGGEVAAAADDTAAASGETARPQEA